MIKKFVAKAVQCEQDCQVEYFQKSLNNLSLLLPYLKLLLFSIHWHLKSRNHPNIFPQTEQIRHVQN